MTNIYLQPEEYIIVKNILNKYPYQFYAFGSRVTGTYKKFFDLDLCYKDPTLLATIAGIEADFADSDLSFKVDLVNWENCTDDFQQLIAKAIVEFKTR